MSKRQAVIFDMDGVIVDSEPCHERAFLEVVREIGYGDTHGLRLADYVGRPDKVIWEDFVAKHRPAQGLDELLARKRQRVIEILAQEQPLFEGLPRLVKKLALRYSLAVASGSERPVVEAVLQFEGLHEFFPIVVTAADAVHGKPSPEIFLRAAALLKVTPADCWVIEDSKPGLKAGLAAGMKVIAITNTHPAEDLSEATHVVDSYPAIGKLLL